MATDTSIDVSVRMDSDGYKTATVRGKRASCTYNPEIAVERLGDKLFPEYHITIERLPCVAVGRMHSKWRITPGAPLNAAENI
ncbi:hypothetical protein [Zestomonas carbonaria]|uniref:Uncharacterized protein n=1 Tax=Zestomonas carbonaria TaxID=2762745 RepID=A0A7U7I8D1_9GAMM|nr:hypothetical protein [Pseudomonas carbonaria]CAD5107199.1 hypothetical protein PSEWESI4_01470 [Pseudomonas carbonaria]